MDHVGLRATSVFTAHERDFDPVFDVYRSLCTQSQWLPPCIIALSATCGFAHLLQVSRPKPREAMNEPDTAWRLLLKSSRIFHLHPYKGVFMRRFESVKDTQIFILMLAAMAIAVLTANVFAG